MKKHKTLEERDLSALSGDHSPDYEEFCNRKLPEEVERLQKIGRTGTEAWIARAKYQSRKIREHLELFEQEKNKYKDALIWCSGLEKVISIEDLQKIMDTAEEVVNKLKKYANNPQNRIYKRT